MKVGRESQNSRVSILGMLVDDIEQDVALDRVISWTKIRKSRVVRVTNVHECMESYDDHTFRTDGNSADLTLIDSRILFWASRLLGRKSAGKLRHGAEIMSSLCTRAQSHQVKIGLYGGTPESLDKLSQRLDESYPDLEVCYSYSPPFRPLNDNEMVTIADAIAKSGTQLLFVGIGCPKQEKWMLAQRSRLDCVMIGVGTAFDILSGVIAPSPKWVHKAGLEWLWRTIKEPVRIGRRNLKHNPRFLVLLGLQLCGFQRAR